jgi:hypothetical protein
MPALPPLFWETSPFGLSLMRCMREILTNHIKKSGINRLVCSGLASLMVAGGLALQPAAFGQVVITVAPPVPIVETIPPSPGPNWVWVGGYHQFRGGRYVWIKGHYAHPPHPGQSWVAGHYDKRGKGWVYVGGHWR